MRAGTGAAVGPTAIPASSPWDEILATPTPASTAGGLVNPATGSTGSGKGPRRAVDISGFGPQARIILTALKKYGMILADNGSPWYLTGAPDSHWDDDQLHDFHQLHGSDLEVVDTTNFR